MTKKIWIVWQYDNGIVPEKELYAACATEHIAQTTKEKAKKTNQDYDYEVESEILQTI